MADVVRTGAIFRVKNPAALRSPMPRLPGVKLLRSRLAVTTPDTPGNAQKSALEQVARPTNNRVIVAGSALMIPTGTHPVQKHTQKKKKAVSAFATPAPVAVLASYSKREREKIKPHNLLADFDSMLSSPETPATPEATRTTASPFSSAASSQKRYKGRKRQRSEPESEPMDSDSDRNHTPIQRSKRHTSDSSDEDAARIQKQLNYDDTPVKTTASHRKSDTNNTLGAKPAKRRRSLKPVAVATSDLEALSSRSTRIRTDVVVLSEWYVEWPPPFVADELQLVVRGQVQGRPASFTVLRRVTPTQLVSTDNQNVRLDGCLDIDAAQRGDVPPRVMELLLEGVPTHWRSRLEVFAPPPDPMVPLLTPKPHKKEAMPASKPATTATKQQKPKASTQRTEAAPAVSKSRAAVTPAAKKKKTTAAAAVNKLKTPARKVPSTPVRAPPVAPPPSSVERRSRSGRKLTPVMEWWRNERKVTTAEFETTIHEGSPSYLPSTRAEDAMSPTKSKLQALWAAQKQTAQWTDEQLAALRDAKVIVPTTDPNFWLQVASYVPGKSADECRQRSYDDLPLPPPPPTATRKASSTTTQPASSAKLHRAGSNLFKKQVRQFVHELEQKTADDVFATETPTKTGLVSGDGLDDLQSPVVHAPHQTQTQDEGSDVDDEGRELLEKVPEAKRSDVDSYVRTLKKGSGGRRGSSATLTTPPKATKKKESVYLTETVGGRVVECIVTPGGTTRVRVERTSEDEEEPDDEEEEEEDESGF